MRWLMETFRSVDCPDRGAELGRREEKSEDSEAPPKRLGSAAPATQDSARHLESGRDRQTPRRSGVVADCSHVCLPPSSPAVQPPGIFMCIKKCAERANDDDSREGLTSGSPEQSMRDSLQGGHCLAPNIYIYIYIWCSGVRGETLVVFEEDSERVSLFSLRSSSSQLEVQEGARRWCGLWVRMRKSSFPGASFAWAKDLGYQFSVDAPDVRSGILWSGDDWMVERSQS
ncbi:unnamed protein product [Calypogeia fissa]